MNPAIGLEFETRIRQGQEGRIIAGVDEAGRGPLAGPVVAAACIIEEGLFFEGVDDSKKLPEKRRLDLYLQLVSSPQVFFSIGVVDSKRIDEINIYQATLEAMRIAVDNLSVKPDFLLVDGMELPHKTPSMKLIRGDQRSHSIAAASILAKVERDRLMHSYGSLYPGYGLERNKGYGTPFHLEALAELGPCAIHRRSFEPVRNAIENQIHLC